MKNLFDFSDAVLNWRNFIGVDKNKVLDNIINELDAELGGLFALDDQNPEESVSMTELPPVPEELPVPNIDLVFYPLGDMSLENPVESFNIRLSDFDSFKEFAIHFAKLTMNKEGLWWDIEADEQIWWEAVFDEDYFNLALSDYWKECNFDFKAKGA